MTGNHAVATYGRSDLGGVLSAQLLVAHVATAQPERARAFYAYALGLALLEESARALVFDAGGTLLRVAKVAHLVPARHPVLGWQVADLESACCGLKSRGIACEMQPGSGRSGALDAWFRDPDGNIVALVQADD